MAAAQSEHVAATRRVSSVLVVSSRVSKVNSWTAIPSARPVVGDMAGAQSQRCGGMRLWSLLRRGATCDVLRRCRLFGRRFFVGELPFTPGRFFLRLEILGNDLSRKNP